ncbi:hypothetical protein N7453_009579 [Penicillium expansum]|nr:hypothetical protein N7453_009579 [Penicillium expansum]
MPSWGRPPGARTGRNTRGRAAWEETRLEEVDSEEDAYGRELVRSSRYKQEYGGRGPRRRPVDYEDLTDESESVDGENTIYTTMRIARSPMRFNWPCGTRKINWWTQRSSEFAVPKFWERRTFGCRNANWMPWSASASSRTVRAEAGALRSTLSRRRRAHRPDGALLLHPSSSPARIRPLRLMHIASGLVGRLPMAGRPAHLLLPVPGLQRPNLFVPSSPIHLFDLPTHHIPPERFAPNGRPQSMQQAPVFQRPLPDDPQWAPPYYNTMQMSPYGEPVPHQPVPTDVRAGQPNRMSYPSTTPYPAYQSQSPGKRPPQATPQTRGSLAPAPALAPSKLGAEESSEESESSEEDEVQIVKVAKVAERKAPPVAAAQRRPVTGTTRKRTSR